MPFIDKEVPSPGISAVAQTLQIVTTTLFQSQGTSASTAIASNAAIPVAAIVGGTVAGALLAVACTAGWIIWGKAIKRDQEKQRNEAAALRTTRNNTRYNASALTKPLGSSYPRHLARPTDTKVKFATRDLAKGGRPPPNTPGRSIPARYEKRNTGRYESRNLIGQIPSKPRPLRAAKAPIHKAEAGELEKPRRPPSPAPVARIVHRSSTISSESVYSAESGEERQGRAPSLLLAALGSLGNSVDAARMSWSERLSTSTYWSFISRSTRGGRSQGSSGSGSVYYSQSEEWEEIGGED